MAGLDLDHGEWDVLSTAHVTQCGIGVMWAGVGADWARRVARGAWDGMCWIRSRSAQRTPWPKRRSSADSTVDTLPHHRPHHQPQQPHVTPPRRCMQEEEPQGKLHPWRTLERPEGAQAAWDRPYVFWPSPPRPPRRRRRPPGRSYNRRSCGHRARGPWRQGVAAPAHSRASWITPLRRTTSPSGNYCMVATPRGVLRAPPHSRRATLTCIARLQASVVCRRTRCRCASATDHICWDQGPERIEIP